MKLLILSLLLVLHQRQSFASPAPQEQEAEASEAASEASSNSQSSYGVNAGWSSQNGPFIQGQAPGAPMGWQTLPAYIGPPQNRGPFIQGQTPGAPSGWQTLPFMVDRQGPFITSGNAQTLPAEISPSRARIPDSWTRPMSYEQISSTNWQPQPVQSFDAYGSLPQESTGVQEIGSNSWNGNWNQASDNSWNRNAWAWTRPAPRYSSYNYWSSNQQQSQERNANAQPQEQVQSIRALSAPAPAETLEASNGAAVTSGWVSGSPTWRRAYTPLPGSSNCFNRCRPSCSNQFGLGYGCMPSCRSKCNIRPTCGYRPSYWQGNTMVCGNNRPNFYNPGWNSGYGSWYEPYGQPQPALQQQATMAEASNLVQETNNENEA